MTTLRECRVNARTAGMAAAALAIMSLLASAPAHAQARAARAPAAAAPSGTGVIGGVVTNDDGSKVVRFAYIVLIGTGTGTVRVSSTDADGRFAFANLPADRYTIGASKPPYIGTVAGARRPGRVGTPIALADGQKIGTVAIRMAMGAAITGVIVDELGQPAGGAMVTLQQWRMQSGERTLMPVAGGSFGTDDRGRYRIYGLLPGEYVVSALRMSVAPQAVRALTAAEVDAAITGGPVAALPAAGPSTARYAPVYFPGTTRPADAMTIALAAGEERDNVDVRLEPVQTARVEGVVISADGQALPPGGSVSLVTIGGPALRGAGAARIGPDGRFVVPNVPPGTYAATFAAPFQAPPPGAAAGAAAPGLYAQTIVDVSGADVFGVELVLRPLLSLSGRIEFRGAAAPPALAGRRLLLRAAPGSAPGAPAPATPVTLVDGSFAARGLVPGAYLLGGPLALGATADSITWTLDSVMVDGRDVTDLPLQVTAEATPKDVVVTYTDRYQELSGRLTQASGAPVSDYTIIVFPEDKAYWIAGSRRIVVSRPGTDGRFTLSGPGPTTLPPGRYRLAAVTDIDRDEQFDPSFLARLVPASVPVTLQPGEKKVQDLAIR